MLNDLTMIFLVTAALLALLAIVQLLLAVRHDRAVTAAGPIEELAVYEARIDQKRELLQDIEEDLERRREALSHVAKVQAEVDALVTQRDNLLAEWASLEERRNEVLAVRKDMEEAMTERQSLVAELTEKRQEYLEVRDRLERAEQLVNRIDALTAEQERLSSKVESLHEEVRRLREAEKRVAELTARATDLENELAQLVGRTDAKRSELQEMESRLAVDRETLSTTQSDLSKAHATIAAAETEIGRQKGELASLEDQKSQIQARMEYLQGEIRKTDSDAATDPLKELLEPPPVIIELKKLGAAEKIHEIEALQNVKRRLRAFGLEYPRRTIHAFHTAMKVNESTQMAVLAGISGTGKSQLPRQYAAGMGIGFLQVPVQPRWDSPQDLMGFYNYIEGKFRPTDMARALWALDTLNDKKSALEDRMMMVLLDEMNLARVEYYFSDFLSRLESRPQRDKVYDRTLRKDAEIELEIPKLAQPPRIFPGYNLLFAGTINEDESTQSLSDKVVDRANILRFSAPRKIVNEKPEGEPPQVPALSEKSWRSWVKSVTGIQAEPDLSKGIEKMVEIMKNFKRPFGHRLGRAVMAYAANYPNVEGTDRIRSALADQVEMRLLPKLRGVEVDAMDVQFSKLRSFVESDLGDEPLAEAIGESIVVAEATGQFVWTGVTR